MVVEVKIEEALESRSPVVLVSVPRQKLIFLAKKILRELSRRRDFVGGCIFGSSARGNRDFKDVDLFVISKDDVSLPFRIGNIELHEATIKKIGKMDPKFLYSVWRDEDFRVGDLLPLEERVKAFLIEKGLKIDRMKMRKAWLGLEDAERHLKIALSSKDRDERDYHMRKACEHAFHSMVVATEELLIMLSYPIPKDHTERFRFLEEVSKLRKEVRKLNLRERLGKAFSTLHVRAYYHGDYDVEEVRERISKAREYVRDIEELSKLQLNNR